MILSRHTVPANKPVLLTTPSKPPAEPIPLTQPQRAPQRLAIQRVASTIGPRPQRSSTTSQVLARQVETEAAPESTWPQPVNVTVETEKKLALDETERIIRRPQPQPIVAQTEPPAKSSDTGERVPVRGPSLIVAAPVPSARPEPAPAPAISKTNGSSPAISTISAVAARPQRKAEDSGLHEAFFSKTQEDVAWESSNEGRWKGYVLIGVLVLVAGGAIIAPRLGSQRKEKAPLDPPAKVAAEKKRADWPATDPAKVEIAASAPVVEQPAAAAEQPAAQQPAAAQPQTQPPPVAVQQPPPAEVKPPAAAEAPKPAVDVAGTLAKGEAALNADRLKEAEKHFRAVIDADAKNASAHSGLAMVLFNFEKDAAAAASARTAISLDAKAARAYLVLGLVASNKQDLPGAKKNYQRYLELEPKGRHADEVRSFMQAQR
jgi:hypothetical protein